MKYNLIIDRLGNQRSANIIAHKLAGGLSISIQKAHSMLENMPLVFLRGCTKDEGTFELTQLLRIGVNGHLIEIVPETRPVHSSPPKVESSPPADHGANLLDQKKQSPESDARQTPAGFDGKPEPKTNFKSAKTASAVFIAGRAEDPANRVENHFFSRRLGLLLVVVITLVALMVVFTGKNRSLSQMVTAFLDRMQQAEPYAFNKPSSGGNSKHSLNRDSLSSGSDSLGRPDTIQGRGGTGENAGSAERAALTSTQKIQCQNYLDSAARIGSTDEEQAIHFYRMAIAFNKYNINAWYGLITAYRTADEPKKAEQTRVDMEKLFGHKVFAIRELVASYGILTDISLAHSGTYRIEYQSNATTPDQLRKQAWKIMQAVASQCNCTAVSINASTEGSLGSLVYCSLHPLPQSEAEFLARAEIRIFR